jgi:hypothetical protein
VNTAKIRQQISAERNSNENKLDYKGLEAKANEIRLAELQIAKMEQDIQQQFANLPADLKLAKRKLDEK